MNPLSVKLTKAMEFDDLRSDKGCIDQTNRPSGVDRQFWCDGAAHEHARLQPFLEVLIEAAKVLDEQHELLHNVRAMISDTDLAHKDIGLHMKTTRELLTKLQTLLDSKEG